MRKVTAGLLVDPPDPGAPTEEEFVATRNFEDNGTDPVTARISIGPAAGFQPAKATTHTLYLAALTSCGGGAGGITATSGGIDVIGTEVGQIAARKSAWRFELSTALRSRCGGCGAVSAAEGVTLPVA